MVAEAALGAGNGAPSGKLADHGVNDGFIRSSPPPEQEPRQQAALSDGAVAMPGAAIAAGEKASST